jgi:hypothetical protein
MSVMHGAKTAQGGGLPKLALTPGTAGRLRRPSRLLDLRGEPGADKENATDESLSPSPSVSPPKAMLMHHNPLSLETPPSSPGKPQYSSVTIELSAPDLLIQLVMCRLYLKSLHIWHMHTMPLM